MTFERYADGKRYHQDVLEALLEHEAQNNLLLSIAKGAETADLAKWLACTVRDGDGGLLLTAVCTPPFNLTLYETGNRPNDEALRLLSREVKGVGFTLPGVLAEESLARRFGDLHAGEGGWERHIRMHLMELRQVAELPSPPGRVRPLREEDLCFTPYWERAFGEECGIENYDLSTHAERIRGRLGKDVHWIWEDGHPAAQAVQGRTTPNGGVVNGVYTPPYCWGRGYATGVVAHVSRRFLEQGKRFCCLFADAENPISCGIYRKLGYKDLCDFDELRFAVPDGERTR